VLLHPGVAVGCVVVGSRGKGHAGSRSDKTSQQRSYASCLALALAYNP
jgi:hypothetical protein